jgi:uncharacterized membrane protein
VRSEERDEHTIHRLEAFSDIVIGFCLAEGALNLALPRSASDLAVTIWTNAQFFLLTFFLVAVLWWYHHRVFRSFFVLTPLTVVLNFALLASLVLSIYFLQVFLHVAASGENPMLFLRLWFYSYVVMYSFLAALILIGLVARRRTLATVDLRWGVQRIVMIVIGVCAFAYAAESGVAVHTRNAGYFFAVVLVAIIIVNRIVLPRFLGRFVPEA